MAKSLVAFFSASGITERVAVKLAIAAGAESYRIEPAQPYTREDLDYTNSNSRSYVEMHDKTSRPKLADKDAKIEEYDVIFLGFPIWWGVAPTIINTFLESYDFAGKTIVPFATSGGHGMGESVEELKGSVAENTVFLPGKRISSKAGQEELKNWVKSLGLE